ncbi:MAG: AMP-binding protein [Polyangiales bacterium]
MAQLIYADVWEAVARAVPERPALIRGEREISWGSFDARADALAHHLLAAGLTRQSKVAAYLYNAPEYLETYFAAFKAGLVPFNTNYRYGGEELFYLLENADAEAVVFHASFAPTLDLIRARLPKLKTLLSVSEPGFPSPDWATDYESAVQQPVARVAPPWGRSPDDLLLIYTGGTTGLPKGVMWRQGDLFDAMGGGVNLLLGLPELRDAAEAGERAHIYDHPSCLLPVPRSIPAAPLMHATAQLSGFSTLVGSGCIATLPSNRFSVEELFDEVQRVQATSLVIVGMAFAMPMLEALDAEPARWDLSSLKRIFSSGTIWSAENKHGLLRHMPHVMFFDSLGSSEAIGLAVTTTAAGSEPPTARFGIGARAAVFTDEGRRVVPGSGERGLVATTGFIPTGYYKDPEKSAKTFRMFEGTRWSLPGDWATVELDGSITLLGRGSLVINTGGEKVFPEEVEEALKRCAGVRDAAVVGLPDPRFGERVCAVIDLEASGETSCAALGVELRRSLASYKVPRDWVVAKVERQPNGKVDYQHARNKALDVIRKAAVRRA